MNSQEPMWPGLDLFVITPSNSVDFTSVARQIYVGGSGNVTVVTQAGTVIPFYNVIAGSTIGPFFVKRVNLTGTTASNLVAFV